MSTANQAEHIESAANGERIEAVTILGSEWESFERAPRQGELLTWDEARPLLDREFDDGGWDGPSALNFLAWTASRVIFCHEYDASTSIAWLPRNPPEVL